jgi:predicted transposase YdaD
VEEEAKKMPILNDIQDHEVLGREYKKGRQEGREEGRQEGELAILSRLLEKRFGALPNWAAERLAKLSTKDLEDLSVRVLDAQSLEDLMK